MKSAKKLLRRCWDERTGQLDDELWSRGVLQHRNTPGRNGRSPAQMVFGRPIRDTIAAHRRNFAPARWYEDGEKSTAYFLGLEKRNYLNKLIASLRDSNDEKRTKQTEIMDILIKHFSDLFAERPIDRVKAEEYVDGLNMKGLSEAQNEEMNRPFTLGELTDALKGMSNNKAPGTDGFLRNFTKYFGKI